MYKCEKKALEFCEKKLKSMGFVVERIKELRKGLRAKSTRNNKAVNLQLKACGSNQYKHDARYTVGEVILERTDIAFCVFYFEKERTPHVVIVPFEKLKSLMGNYRDVSTQYNFGFNLSEGAHVDVFLRGNNKRCFAYSEYLDEKGWSLVEKALT